MFKNKGRRAMDRMPITNKLSYFWFEWRAAIRRDPALRENIVFALCGVVFLAGLCMGAK